MGGKVRYAEMFAMQQVPITLPNTLLLYQIKDFSIADSYIMRWFMQILTSILFCVTRYGWGWENYKAEVNTGKGLKVHDWMRGYLTYGLPLIVIFIFLFPVM